MIEQIFQDAGHTVTLRETNRRGHATRFAQDAARRNLDAVVALGGDGTLNEVANGLAGSQTALAVLPGGSTNVFARTLGLPNDPVAAAQLVADALTANSIRPIGLGRVNGRYFCFHTGVGYDAAVVAQVERHASLKRWLGHPLFIVAALQTFFRQYDRRNPHFSLKFSHDTIPDGFFTIVMNTNPYTFLGNRPIDLVPGEGLDSPLSIVTFRSLKAPSFLTGLGAALLGRGVSGKSIDVRRNVRCLVIEDSEPFAYQVDGDHLGDTRRLAFEWIPDVIRIAVPLVVEGP